MQLLCLDDHAADLAAHLAALQERLAVTVHTAHSCEDANAKAKEHPIDLFILDIELGRSEQSGIQLARQWRLCDRYRQTPIVFISMYSHYSRYVLSAVEHSTFLSKPFSTDTLVAKVGMLLGMPQYLEQAYTDAKLAVPTTQGSFIEIDAHRILYMELIRSQLHIQCIDGTAMTVKSGHGQFKALLEEIHAARASHLRQVYRSVIINIHQIRQLTMEKNRGEVLLFHDDIPKPVGNRYRDQLAEFL